MFKIGDEVSILGWDAAQQHMMIEGKAFVVAESGHAHKYWVLFKDKAIVALRYVDPAAHAIGVEDYVDQFNMALDAVGNAGKEQGREPVTYRKVTMVPNGVATSTP